MNLKAFPRTFWVANAIELLERLAFYGMILSSPFILLEGLGLAPNWLYQLLVFLSLPFIFYPL